MREDERERGVNMQRRRRWCQKLVLLAVTSPSPPHMGAAEISAGGAKKFFQGGGLQKKIQGGGLFSKLRVWVGMGSKEKFSITNAILEKKFFKEIIFLKNLVVLYIFNGSGRGKPW